MLRASETVVQIGTQRRVPAPDRAKKQWSTRVCSSKSPRRHLLLLCDAVKRHPPWKKCRISRLLMRRPARSQYDGTSHSAVANITEYGNGIVGRMCVHMFHGALVSIWLQSGWSIGGNTCRDGQSNISDTQSAVFEYDACRSWRMHWVRQTIRITRGRSHPRGERWAQASPMARTSPEMTRTLSRFISTAPSKGEIPQDTRRRRSI